MIHCHICGKEIMRSKDEYGVNTLYGDNVKRRLYLCKDHAYEIQEHISNRRTDEVKL